MLLQTRQNDGDMKTKTVVLIDDHNLVREMVVEILAYKKELEIVGESALPEEGIELVRKTKPDLVLLDITFAGKPVFDALKTIMEISPETRVVAVSMHKNPVYARKMLLCGAKGYITKSSTLDEMLYGIREVMAGKIFLCEEITEQLVEHMFGEN